MNVLNLFRRAAPAVEKRAAGSGFTGEVMRLREAYIRGTTGLAELTGTVSSCVALWQGGLSLAHVSGTDMLTPSMLSMIARSLALRGEFVALIDGDMLVPASDWDTRTRNSIPIAYRLSIPEAVVTDAVQPIHETYQFSYVTVANENLRLRLGLASFQH